MIKARGRQGSVTAVTTGACFFFVAEQAAWRM